MNKAWSRPEVFGNIPGARDGHSSCVVDAKMYIFGGYEEDVCFVSHLLNINNVRPLIF